MFKILTKKEWDKIYNEMVALVNTELSKAYEDELEKLRKENLEAKTQNSILNKVLVTRILKAEEMVNSYKEKVGALDNEEEIANKYKEKLEEELKTEFKNIITSRLMPTKKA
jgi:hypothetical protein